ncbi:MAG: DMT family transporter [Rhodospirillaceae bacterium]|nr:DMT family transporter [Rhodospirillaceae bacterium]
MNRNKMRIPPVVTGVLFASLSTMIGGVTVVLTRLTISQSDSLTFASVRYGLAAIFLLAVLLITARIPRVSRRDFVWLGIFGVIMFSGFPFFMTRALEDTTAARGALVFATLPLTTIVIGALFRIERLTLRKIIGIGIAITGTSIVLGESVAAAAPNALRGDAFMFLAILCAAFFNVFSIGYFKRYGSLAVVSLTMTIGSAVLFALAIAFGHPFSGSLDFDLQGWFIMFLLAIPGAALMNFLWGRALQLITPTQATITVGLNPVTALFLGAWILSEPITVRIIIGVALLITAIIVTTSDNRAPTAKTR